jgi:hypothetical protein
VRIMFTAGFVAKLVLFGATMATLAGVLVLR